jgi:signal peptidase I
MPGATNCGRCGGTLRAAAAAIDVHPPRASKRAKFWRRSLPTWGRSGTRLRDGAEAALSTVLGSWRPTDVRASGVFRRMVIPGWAQIHCRHRLRGQLLMSAWLACLVPGVVFAGTGGGSFLLGLAVAVHAISVLDIVLVDAQSMLERIGRGMLALLAVNGLIYIPATLLVGQFAAPQTFMGNTDHFSPGDVVLVNSLAYRWSEPQVGDVVQYEIPELTATGRTAMGQNARFEVGGRRIDRVLASGGQHVVFKEGKLTVDGIATDDRPLSTLGMPATLDIRVPERSFLIVPSLDGYLPPELVPDVGIVGRSRIHGRAWWQSQPLSSFGPVN